LCATGNWRKSQDNLNPKYYEAFADYLTEVVLQYKKWGLQFDTLAPFNEPCEGWWYIDRNKAAQEGCNFSARSMDKVGAQWKAFLPISSNF
jgi:O-glycosyl hydrolase